MGNTKGRTITIPKKGNNGIEEWLEANCKASTGPYPNITGMRNLYWGQNALIVKCGAYIYLMAREDDGRDIIFNGRHFG